MSKEHTAMNEVSQGAVEQVESNVGFTQRLLTELLLLFKRKTLPKDIIPYGIVVHVLPKGWMDEKGIKLWFDKVWLKCPSGLLIKTTPACVGPVSHPQNKVY